MGHQNVIDFWFVEVGPKQWWRRNPDFDKQIAERFGAVHERAGQCEWYEWRVHTLGRLAEIIVLDQFSRNILPRQGTSVRKTDPLALALAQEAVAKKRCRCPSSQSSGHVCICPTCTANRGRFTRLPFAFFPTAAFEASLDSELKHKAIIDRFGRYPHRNSILGRVSSEEEREFLKNWADRHAGAAARPTQ